MTAVAAVAWDIDGTLVDSEPLHLEALEAVCDRYGLDLRWLPKDEFRGVDVFDVWTRLAPLLPKGLERDAWIGQITQVYVEQVAGLAPQPGAVEAIEALAARGVRQVAVSNSNRVITDANIGALGIGGFLEFCISLDDVASGKPDPEPYCQACRRLGLEPPAVACVEDSVTGAASARAAGLFVIGYSPIGEILPGADALAASLKDIPLCLRRAAS